MRFLFTLLFLFSFTFEAFGSSDRNGWRLAGDTFEIVLPATAFALTVGMHDWEGSKQFVKGFLATQITSYGLKYTIPAKRPRGGKNSFPSGHTATAFSGSGFIHFRYGWKAAVLAHGAAIAVGYSRVKTKAHWPQDVIAGAAIGLFFSYYFTTPYEYKGYYFTTCVNSDCLALVCQKTF